jgi:hypothetical protein
MKKILTSPLLSLALSILITIGMIAMVVESRITEKRNIQALHDTRVQWFTNGFNLGALTFGQAVVERLANGTQLPPTMEAIEQYSRTKFPEMWEEAHRK